MGIESVGSGLTTSREPAPPISAAQATKNQFLQMLITQMKNQDPMSPMDSNQFMEQTMSMNQLEQMVNLNETMGQFVQSQQGALISQYSGIVGRDVLANGDQVQVAGSVPGIFTFDLPSTPKKVEINIFDRSGNIVRTLQPAVSTSGQHSVLFDGKGAQGEKLPDGYYTYKVGAVDNQDNPILSKTYSTAKISSIKLENGNPILQMGGKDVGISDILRIY